MKFGRLKSFVNRLRVKPVKRYSLSLKTLPSTKPLWRNITLVFLEVPKDKLRIKSLKFLEELC